MQATTDNSGARRTPFTSSNRSSLLDAVRGVAILQIVVWHYIYEPVDTFSHLLGLPLSMTWAGVELFFVLSGYLIGGILLDQRAAANYYQVFYARRALRIMPLYGLLLICFFAVCGTANWPYYLTLTQNFLTAARGDWGPPWVGVTWSLAVEEQFYLFLPLLIRVVPARFLPYVLMALVASAPLFRHFAKTMLSDPLPAYVLLPGRMDPLFTGVILAWLMRQPVLLTTIRQSGLLKPALLLLWAGYLIYLAEVFSPLPSLLHDLRYTWLGLTFATTLLALEMNPASNGWTARNLRWLSAAGLAAYSVYLFHIPVLLTVRQSGLPGTIALASIMVAVLAFGLWHLVEKPLIRFGQRRFRYARPEPDAVAAALPAAPAAA